MTWFSWSRGAQQNARYAVSTIPVKGPSVMYRGDGAKVGSLNMSDGGRSGSLYVLEVLMKVGSERSRRNFLYSSCMGAGM